MNASPEGLEGLAQWLRDEAGIIRNLRTHANLERWATAVESLQSENSALRQLLGDVLKSLGIQSVASGSAGEPLVHPTALAGNVASLAVDCVTVSHTPGPWGLNGGVESDENGADDGVWVRVSDADGARVFEWSGDAGPDAERAYSTARLVAAAPELLGTLRAVLEFAEDREDITDGPDGLPQPNDAMRLAETLREAIAKATGSATPQPPSPHRI